MSHGEIFDAINILSNLQIHGQVLQNLNGSAELECAEHSLRSRSPGRNTAEAATPMLLISAVIIPQILKCSSRARSANNADSNSLRQFLPQAYAGRIQQILFFKKDQNSHAFCDLECAHRDLRLRQTLPIVPLAS